MALTDVDPGYNAEQVLTFQVSTRGSTAEQRAIADAVRELPGVIAAGYGTISRWWRRGHGFLPALGIRVVEGRGFDPGDTARREALVNRAIAASGFFAGPVLGSVAYSDRRTSWTVVGIVDNVRPWGLDQQPAPKLYIVSGRHPLRRRLPVTFAGVAAGFAIVAALSTFVPARRATRVDPMTALGCE